MDDFLEELRREKASEFRKLLNLFQFFCNSEIRNDEKLKHVQEGLFELKSYQIRIFFFYHVGIRNVVVCAHGIEKKKDKVPQTEIDKALRKKRDFEEAHKGGKK